MAITSFQIEVQQNGTSQTKHFNQAPISLGRDRGAALVIDHQTVSRQHGQIFYSPQQGFVLRVLSTSGLTAVDGVQVSGDVPLYDGSIVRMGEVTLVFRSPQARPRPAAASPFGPPGNAASPGFPQPGASSPSGFSQPGAPGFAQPTSTGFEPPNSTPGFAPPGAPSAQSGFNALPGAPATPNASPGFASSQLPGGVEASGFESLNALSSSPSMPKASNVWDEIAQSAGEHEEEENAGLRDEQYFKRMEEAESKGKEQLKGKFNPLVFVGIAAIAGLLLFLLFGGEQSAPQETASLSKEQRAEVVFDVECSGKEDCLAAAQERYEVAKENFQTRTVKMGHTYLSFKQMTEAKMLLEKGGVTSAPAAMSDLDEIIAASRQELDDLYAEQQRTYLMYRQRKMYANMVDALRLIKSYFPDPNSEEARWAAQKEQAMRQSGVYLQ